MKYIVVPMIIPDCGTLLIPKDLLTAAKPWSLAMVYSDK